MLLTCSQVACLLTTRLLGDARHGARVLARPLLHQPCRLLLLRRGARHLGGLVRVRVRVRVRDRARARARVRDRDRVRDRVRARVRIRVRGRVRASR